MVFGYSSDQSVNLYIGLDTTGITQGVEEAKRKLTELGRGVEDLGSKSIDWSKVFAISAAVTAGATALTLIGDKLNVYNSRLDASATQLGITRQRVIDLYLSQNSATMTMDEYSATFDTLTRTGMDNADQIHQNVLAFDDLGDVVGENSNQIANELTPAFLAFKIPLKDVGEYIDQLAYLYRTANVSMGDFGSMAMRTGSTLQALGLTMTDEIALLEVIKNKTGREGRAALMILNSAISEVEESQTKATQAAKDYADAQSQINDINEQAADITEDYQDTLANFAKEQTRIDDLAKSYTVRIGDQQKAISRLTSEYNAAMAAARDTASTKADIEQDYTDRITDQQTKIQRIKEDYTASMRAAAFDSNKKRELTEDYNRALADEEETLARLKRDKGQDLAAVDTSAQERQVQLTEDYNQRLADQQEQLRRVEEERDKALSSASAELEESRTKAAEDYNERLGETATKISELTAKQAEYQRVIDSGGNVNIYGGLAQYGITPEDLAKEKAKLLAESPGTVATYAPIGEQAAPELTEKEVSLFREFIRSGKSDLLSENVGLTSSIGLISSGITGVSGLVSIAKLFGLGGGLAGGAGGIAGGLGGAATTTTAASGWALGAGEAAVGMGAGEAGAFAATLPGTAAADAALYSEVFGSELAAGEAGMLAGMGEGGATVTTVATASGAAMAAAIGTGLLAGLVVVRGMTESGLLRDIAGYGRQISNRYPVIMNAAKILFAPIGAVGSVAIDVANLQFDKIPEHLWEIAEQTKQAAEELIAGFTDILFGGFSTIIAGVVEWGSEFITSMSEPFTTLISDVTGWGASVIAGFSQGITSGWSTLTGTVGRIAGAISGAIPSANTAYGWGRGVIDGFVDGIWSMYANTVSAINSIRDVPVTFIGNMYDMANGWGRNLIIGFGNGIISLAYGAGSWFWNAINNVADIIRNILGIHSNAKTGPLSDLMSWGPNLTKSFASGMLDEIDQVRSSALALASAASGTASLGLDTSAIDGMNSGVIGTVGVQNLVSIASQPTSGATAPRSSVSSTSKIYATTIQLDNVTIRDERDLETLATLIDRKLGERAV